MKLPAVRASQCGSSRFKTHYFSLVQFLVVWKSMDFVRSYFGTNEPLTSWTLFSSLFDWSHSKPVKKWGKKCSTGQRFICTEVTSYKIHILRAYCPSICILCRETLNIWQAYMACYVNWPTTTKRGLLSPNVCVFMSCNNNNTTMHISWIEYEKVTC